MTTRDYPQIGTSLLGDHQRLEALFEHLLDAASAGVDKRTLVEMWDRFEQDLSDHMDFEEQDVLPRFAPTHPEDCAAILAEHRRLRELLLQAGVLVDLGMAREPAVQELVARIRAHTALEERILSNWIDPDLARDVMTW